MKKALSILGIVLMAMGVTFVITWSAVQSYHISVVNAYEQLILEYEEGIPLEYRQGLKDAEKYLEVKDYIDTFFVGNYDKKTMDDYVGEAMVASLGDRWSYYLTAEDYGAYAERINNAYVGIGITISAYYVDETLAGYEIVAVTAAGPADIAGLMVKDIIVGAEGRLTSEMTMDELKSLVRGEDGTPVSLTLDRDGELIEISIVRGSIEVEAVTHKMLEDNVGLISIYNFDSGIAEKAIAAVDELVSQGAQGIVFDVRNNPGGLLNELLDLLDHLLPKGDLFVSRNNLSGEKVYTSSDACVELPMAVLVNANSFSAAEFFAACLQEYGWAKVVGEATTGKGYSQQSFRLGDGSAVVISTNEYFTPGRVSLAETGIEPDYPVEIDDEELVSVYYGTVEPKDDSQLQEAVTVILQLAHGLEDAS